MHLLVAFSQSLTEIPVCNIGVCKMFRAVLLSPRSSQKYTIRKRSINMDMGLYNCTQLKQRRQFCGIIKWICSFVLNLLAHGIINNYMQGAGVSYGKITSLL